MTLAEIGKRLGRKGLNQIASVAKPEILAWYRRLIAQKFDGSKHRNAGEYLRENTCPKECIPKYRGTVEYVTGPVLKLGSREVMQVESK